MKRAAVWILSAALLHGPAHALLGNACVDANSVSSPWAGVGAITLAGGGTYSGALIGPSQVLTAAHVVSGQQATPGNITFNLNYGGDITYRIPATAVHVFPTYQGTQPGRQGFWHDDIAVVELAAPVPAGVPIYPLYRGIPGLDGKNRELTFVGYGAGGDADGQHLPPNPRVKRVGRNSLEMLVPNDSRDIGFDLFVFGLKPGPANAPDCGRQETTFMQAAGALFAGGDSGSPVFVEEDGVWKIAGVATFATPLARNTARDTTRPAIAGGALVTPYASWIAQQLDRGPTGHGRALPPWALASLTALVAALGLGLWHARGRRHG